MTGKPAEFDIGLKRIVTCPGFFSGANGYTGWVVYIFSWPPWYMDVGPQVLLLFCDSDYPYDCRLWTPPSPLLHCRSTLAEEPLRETHQVGPFTWRVAEGSLVSSMLSGGRGLLPSGFVVSRRVDPKVGQINVAGSHCHMDLCILWWPSLVYLLRASNGRLRASFSAAKTRLSRAHLLDGYPISSLMYGRTTVGCKTLA